MHFDNSFTVSKPIDEVWSMMLDLEQVVPWIHEDCGGPREIATLGVSLGAFHAVTRIDRDIRPIFTANPDVGGVIDRYPFVNSGWTGSKVGDFLIGAKVNLLSETH